MNQHHLVLKVEFFLGKYFWEQKKTEEKNKWKINENKNFGQNFFFQYYSPKFSLHSNRISFGQIIKTIFGPAFSVVLFNLVAKMKIFLSKIPQIHAKF